MDGLRAATEAWLECLALSDANPLFNDPYWAQEYAAARLSSEDVFGWTLRNGDGEVIAVLPFRHELPRSRFSLCRALLLADGSFDSDYLDFPIRRGYEDQALATCLDLLAGERGLDAMVLSPIPSASETLKRLRPELERRGLPSRERTVECCVAQLPATFEAYITGLKPRMRTKLRAALRTAEEQGFSFHWCDRADELDQHLEGLFQLHAMRWEAAGEEGSFREEGRCRFYRAVAQRFLKRGDLRFARLERDGEAIAYQFGPVVEGTYYQLQEGFHTDYMKARVGIALRALSLRHLIEEGVHAYDFMEGVSRHKTDWGAEVLHCTTIAFALPRVRARLSYSARSLIDRWWPPENPSL
ncbi:MAG: hypothetical protein DRQ55_16585 [Planctomycetota bacterium]|nr:MAG: hypothetical protein DRQ55_16585 [Planctomycetota bacterium]